MDFICIKKCFWDTLIEENELITVPNESAIPPSIRPFFNSKKEADALKAEIKEESEDEKIEQLRAELDILGKPYDRRWGSGRLEGILQLAKRDTGLSP